MKMNGWAAIVLRFAAEAFRAHAKNRLNDSA